MLNKNNVIKKEVANKSSNDLSLVLDKKIEFFKDIIQKTVIHVHRNKNLEILGVSDVNSCIEKLSDISRKIEDIAGTMATTPTDNTINNLQLINNEFSTLLKNYGTNSFEDLLLICLGNNNKIVSNEAEYLKLELMKKYFHPTSYKVIPRKDDNKKKDDMDDNTPNLECVDIVTSYKQFQMKVHGVKINVYSHQMKKSLLVTGILDDIIIEFINNKYITDKISYIKNNIPNDNEFTSDAFEKFITSLTLKDFLIYEKSSDIYSKYMGIITQNSIIKQKQISQVVKEFISDDLYNKRNILITLLIKSSNYENQYLAYLLYDLLSNDSNGNVDSLEQNLLFDSFPWTIRQFFKQAMNKTIQYTNELSNFDINKIPLEQQICLLKASDTVKEKAMLKLKEVKAKSEDSGSKARQYLDGLLKIPFGIYRREPILNVMESIRCNFKDMFKKYNLNQIFTDFKIKEKYTSIEILKYLKIMQGNSDAKSDLEKINKIKEYFAGCDKKKMTANVKVLDGILKNHNRPKLKITNLTKEALLSLILNIIDFYYTNKDIESKQIIDEIINCFNESSSINPLLTNLDIKEDIEKINSDIKQINDYIGEVKSTLDKAVHGHDKAKKQIERIIGQWITGEQDGYCFGFEGPPGVGKCFAKNTPIMLFNGHVKMVQDICESDLLMGDDSTPRNVLALGRGREKMYKIVQDNADVYTVNESHILSLMIVTDFGHHIIIYGKEVSNGDIIDISIGNYLSLPIKIRKCLHGYKVGIEFAAKPVEFDSYLLGYWLGLSKKQRKYYHNEVMFEYIKNFFLDGEYIPSEYRCNSRQIRLKLLTGLIDTNARFRNKRCRLVFSIDKGRLVEDILLVLWSLGIPCHTNLGRVYKDGSQRKLFIKIKKSYLKDIPLVFQRNKTMTNEKEHNGYITSAIKVIPMEEDEYYGFHIDGNSRFLLGDFTVAHNTSLAKRGLSDCLKDDKGNSRPFAMIQMGGDSNGSTLHGHNYTYVGSTWGSIVQILIDKKCMNPIIFIDEVDKISRTEHGKEIVGILTHLLDPAQNDCFQDKYFTGIDLDLSKALFILSYNDVEAIDKILLDRVHRIKFNNLSLEDKLIICNTHILPEVYRKMGLDDTIHFHDEVLKYIIDEYTSESGVRKLKEILFEIIGEINLEVLKNSGKQYSLPIEISINDIKTKYFKDKHEIKHKKIHTVSRVGVINGLWANSLGRGGVIPIQVSWRPSEKFLALHLTGMQGDVMKESMNVALTLAWDLTNLERRDDIWSSQSSRVNGIHIHCPEGATPKDGPSAGTAITTAIYSLLNEKKIKYNIAITGEICLNGNVTEIGGLDLKILGAIKAGVKEILFPVENTKDYNTFLEKYKDSDLLDGIKFHPVSNIIQVFDLVFED